MKFAIATLIFVLLFGCSGGNPVVNNPVRTKAPDENATLAVMAKINEAQSAYFSRNRRYALAYDELVESRMLNSEPTSAETGYEIKMRPAPDAQSYTLSAVPSPDSPSARHFFANQSGEIRAEQGKDATITSPIIPR